MHTNPSQSKLSTNGKVYAFYSDVSSKSGDGREGYNFFAEGSAPNFFKGDTYIGGSTSSNTFELWKSTLTEEQLEQYEAGTYAVPANVSLPGDGEFARQWWYDQQSAEDQALIDSGELEYPTHLAAATFTDTFNLGVTTNINLLSNGRGEFSGGLKITGNNNNNQGISGDSQGVLLHSEDIASYVRAANKNQAYGVKLEGGRQGFTRGSSGDAYGLQLSSIYTPANNTNVTGIRCVEAEIDGDLDGATIRGYSTGDFGSGADPDTVYYFVARDTVGRDAIADSNYGFFSGINNTDGKVAYNFFAEGSAPNFFKGDTYIGGSTSSNTFELWKSTLTEEQKEQLAAGTLAIPANVSTPGDGSFARTWWYNQQSAEDQALIDSGELDYPEHFQAANFTNTFTNPESTNISLNSDGTSLFKGTCELRNTVPQFRMTNTQGAADNRAFLFRNTSSGAKLQILAVNDSGGASGNSISFERSDNSITSFSCISGGSAWFVCDNINKTVVTEGEIQVVPKTSEGNPGEDENSGVLLQTGVIYAGRNSGTAGNAIQHLNRSGSTTGALLEFREGGVYRDAIVLDGSGGVQMGTSDYRLKENIVDLPSATDTIKALRPVNFNFKSHPGKTRPGFIAHEISETLPVAVTGEKDATEAIGTLADYDGTVLETEVTEPDASELTYTEDVETDGVTTQTVRTRTWTATGTRPVYQGVDQTKLIPLLTKALQEALTEIDTLKGRLDILEGN